MRVFVTAAGGVEVGTVLGVLRDLDVDAAALTDLAAGSQFAYIDPPDALVAILAGGAETPSGPAAVHVEIGIALGSGVPVFLVVEPPLTAPAALQALPQVVTGHSDEANLRLHLSSFLKGVGRQRPPVRAPAGSPADTAGIQLQLEEIRERAAARSPQRSAYDFERFVEDLLGAAGAVVVPASDLSDEGLTARVDFALMVPGEEERLGLMLVEVKFASGGGARTRDMLTQAKLQLQEYVLQSRAGLGLLLYDAPGIGEGELPSVSLVLDLSIDRLRQELATDSLAATLVAARNKAIHSL